MRFSLLLCWLLFLVSPVSAQQPHAPQQNQQMTTLPPAPQDPQAVSVLNQAVAVAGGTAAIKAVTDYTGTGTITYHFAKDLQGTVTVRGSGLGKFRLDAILPTGMRSESVNGPITIKTEDGGVTQLPLHAPMNPTRLVLPYKLIAVAVNSPGFNIFYKGLVDLDGRSAHDVQLVRVLPGGNDPTGIILEYSTIDFFVDPSTLEVLMMQDVVRKNLFRQVRYSDYRLVNGVLVPFSISEHGGEQPAWEMNLSQIIFNSGLQDSDFQL